MAFIKALVKTVVITFEVDGGSTVSPLTVKRGATWAQIKDSIQAPTKPGHTFNHWSTEAAGTAITDDHVFNGPVTIYAVYGINTVTVTFNANGGSPTPEAKTVDYGTTWAQIKDSIQAPTKAGHKFLGWEVV